MPAQVAAPAYAAQPAAPQPVRTVPMDPPAGAYNGGAAQPAQAVDPFLRRAEASGGDISFG